MDLTAQRGYDKKGQFIGHMMASEKDWKKRKYPGYIQDGIWNKQRLQKEMQPAWDFAKANNLTVWCGEFGIARWANGSINWFKDMITTLNENKTGWAYYSFREWQPMDLEMDLKIKNKKTPRSETEFSKILRQEYSQ